MIKGKLDNHTLERLVLGRTGASRPEVIVGPGIGQDCAVMDFGDYECVLSTDPITASASRIGFLAVHVSCNDVASKGVEPIAVMLTVLLPPAVTEDEISDIARQADEAAKSLGVQIVGGHTEVTDSVTQPLVSATAIGRRSVSCGGQPAVPLRFDGMKPDSKSSHQNNYQVSYANLQGTAGCPLHDSGDMIVVTKTLALEGTAIVAEHKGQELQPYLTDEEIGRAKAMIDQISVVKEGVIAGRLGIETMHDITEGGVLGAVWETCARLGVGAEIDAFALPFDPVTMTICALLDLDPMRLISSGSMLMFVKNDIWDSLSAELTDAGIMAAVIGKVQPSGHGIALIMKNGERETIGPPGPDEIYKI